jgi:hypothetical protein
MSEHQSLLDEARKYCDPNTGEVIKLIPKELMTQLRSAKLAVGIWGRQCRTATSAKWFVFFNDEIRDQALSEWREANRKRRRVRRRPTNGGGAPAAGDAGSKGKDPENRGLRRFVRKKRSGE